MNNQKQKKHLLKYARFSGIAFQLGATIYLAAYVGKWLDNKFLMEKKIFTLTLIVVGLIATIWSINKQLIKINKEE